ncbi:MAG: YARHG domain-containing protein [Chryseobacterium sp.]|nr:YARHG domain-containing protein [Chryseobacterium sp.]
MKHLNLILTSLILSLTVISCKKEKTEISETKPEKDSLIANQTPEIHKEMYGVYYGFFSPDYSINDGEYDEEDMVKKISFKINKITKDSVYGQSVLNGNQRLFRGILNENTNSFILDEPGDDKTDGRFDVKIKGDSLVGIWTAFDQTAVRIKKKGLKLVKKEFVYNPNFMLDKDTDVVDWTSHKMKKMSFGKDENGNDQGTYETDQQRYATNAIFTINASKQKLKEKDLKNLPKLDMEIIKNAIFARHGYSFKKETFRQFFNQSDWYVPVSNNVDAELSPLEKENAALLNRFIKYAEDHYDTFGR